MAVHRDEKKQIEMNNTREWMKLYGDLIKEVNGRFTCTLCGYEWSAMLGDDEIPEICTCEEEKVVIDV